MAIRKCLKFDVCALDDVVCVTGAYWPAANHINGPNLSRVQKGEEIDLNKKVRLFGSRRLLFALKILRSIFQQLGVAWSL